MDATTTRPSLLSAAKNFIRKSAGSAVVVIVPLAAVTAASTAKAQTLFASPTVSTNSAGTVYVTGLNFSGGGVFYFSGGAGANNINLSRVGTTGYFYTESGAGTSANVTLSLFSTISGDPINPTTIIPVAYDFTLTKQSGSIGNVSWMAHAEIPGDDAYLIGSGTLTTASATFTGTGNYTVLDTILGYTASDFKVYLTLTYSTAYQQELAVIMNSSSQGFTINAAAIPEPSTYAMIFGLGALGFVIIRRSRRAAA